VGRQLGRVLNVPLRSAAAGCPPRTRDGFALFAALVALLVVGTLVTAGFYRVSGSFAAEPAESERVALAMADAGVAAALLDLGRAGTGARATDSARVGRVEDAGAARRGFLASAERRRDGQLVITSTGMHAGNGATIYCTVVVRVRDREGRPAGTRRPDRTCRQHA
jgi:hypothetical protein